MGCGRNEKRVLQGEVLPFLFLGGGGVVNCIIRLSYSLKIWLKVDTVPASSVPEQLPFNGDL